MLCLCCDNAENRLPFPVLRSPFPHAGVVVCPRCAIDALMLCFNCAHAVLKDQHAMMALGKCMLYPTT